MTSRADMVRKGTAALADVNADFEPYRDGTPDGNAVDYATAVLDAVLPQVSTVAELEALPIGAVVVSTTGEAYTWLGGVFISTQNGHACWSSAETLWESITDDENGPLTVVFER